MGIEQRLTETFRDLVDAAKREEPAVVQALVDAVEGGLSPTGETRKLASGAKVRSVDVNMSGLAGIGNNLKDEVRQVAKHIAQEIKLRGEPWASECLHAAVTEFLVAPLEAHLAANPAPAPAPASTSTGATA